MNGPLLSIENLHVAFGGPSGHVAAVQGVTLAIHAGECVAIVGESGSGKTQLFMATLGLLPPNGRTAGSVRYAGQELLGATGETLRRVRGAGIATVFQDPLSSLTPHLTVGAQVSEVLVAHGLARGVEARRRAVDSIAAVGLPDPARLVDRYPHELSGGMRQRVAIAAALVAGPRLLVADEPTTALDVSTQAQIVELLDRERRRGLAVAFVSHDLALVSTIADRIVVMYAGRIVESGAAREICSRPRHPYTRALLGAVPDLAMNRAQRLAEIAGQPPGPGQSLPGCPFEPRCSARIEICARSMPALQTASPSASVACHVATGATA